MTDRYSFTRHPIHSGDLEAALDAYYRMPGSTLSQRESPPESPGLPFTNDRQGAPNIPCARPVSHDRDGSISSFRKVSIAQFPPGHLSSFSSNRIGGIVNWKTQSHRQTPEIWPG